MSPPDRRGATVALAGRPSDRLDELARELGAAGGHLDVSEPTSWNPW